MNVEITIDYEITERMIENIANDFLQMIVNNCKGDEETYREEYENLIDNNLDLLSYIEDYNFTLGNENYFTGLDIETIKFYDLCEEVRKIVLKKMKEDLNFLY